MHNGQTADPLNYWSKQIKSISSKRSKVDSDYEELSRLEWFAGLYTKDKKPCIPGNLIEACVREAGKTKKLGKVIVAAFFCDEVFPLDFPDQGKELDELFLDDEYRFTVNVRIQNARLPRTRARFNTWSSNIEVHYDDSVIDENTMLELLEISGNKGLGDWRPKFGRFTVEKI